MQKLGKRLAAAERPSTEDLELLERFRQEHDGPSDVVVSALRQLGLQPTSRPKTTGTIIEKLRRERGMSLARMDDVAGVRVVFGGNRNAQDQLIRDITSALTELAEVKLKDRRAEPSHGYRAVHLITRVDSYLVEVQVRTKRQDQWAQMVERLADAWGRQIRYGGDPDDPDREAVKGWTRRDIVTFVLAVAESVDIVERWEAAVETNRVLTERALAYPDDVRRQVGIDADMDQVAANEAELEQGIQSLDSNLRLIWEVLLPPPAS
jgi:hypothetical protein